MAPPRAALGLRPILVLAALALVVVAAVAIGGGAFRNAVEPPFPSPSSTPSPSVSPSPARFAFDLAVPAGQRQTMTVIDESGRVTEAASGAPDGETGTTYPFDSVDVTNLDAKTLQLGWSGYPCATDHTLEIGPAGRTMTLTRPPCQGDTDTIAIDRIVVLVFAEPVDAADVEVTLAE